MGRQKRRSAAQSFRRLPGVESLETRLVMNGAPVAKEDVYETVAAETLRVSADRGLLLNDTDADGDLLKARLVSEPTHGNLVLNSDGSFIYKADTGYRGPDSFRYRVSDGTDPSETVEVFLVPRRQMADDNDSAFATVGNWLETGSGLLNGSRFRPAGTGRYQATWTFHVTPGEYRVFATWKEASNRATNAPFAIFDGSRVASRVRINQELAPNDLVSGGAKWESLGEPVIVTGDTLSVRLTDDANQLVVADCIRVERLPVAFEGAVGFGAHASGGRGGDVYYVTNLEDYKANEAPIPGSLRNGIQTAIRPRTIVFAVSGNLGLDRELTIRNRQDLTIAGQTAPGGGITIYGYRTVVEHSDNVIIRYLRFRTGDFNGKAVGSKAAKGNGDLTGDQGDALEVVYSQNVILDHITTAWGMDETLSVTRSRAVTVQNSIIAESLNDSYHPKGKHGFGSLVRGEQTDDDRDLGTGGVTFYGNLLAKHWVRVPAVSAAPRTGSRGRTDFELVNNVIYDWGQSAAHTDGLMADQEDLRMNVVGNYLIAGPDAVAVNAHTAFVEYVGTGTQLFHGNTNYMDSDLDSTHDGSAVGNDAFKRLETEFASHRFEFPLKPDEIMTAPEAYDHVLESAGASLARDAHDQRLMDEVVQRNGRIIDSQADLMGIAGMQALLTTASPAAPADRDKDGMPDAWEASHGLNPNNAADRNRFGLSPAGYTNLEVYLNSLTPGS